MQQKQEIGVLGDRDTEVSDSNEDPLVLAWVRGRVEESRAVC